jgi:predicted NBD/HSP70 family sugar kinase
MTVIAGIDVGGTAVKMGLVAEGGGLLSKTAVDIDSRKSFDQLIDSIDAKLIWPGISSNAP